MADESMVRNLAAQAEAIWPQERPLFERYRLEGTPRILDAGCGTGEGAWRLAELYPRATVLGVDFLDLHLELARKRHARYAPQLSFEHRSVFELGLPDASFDLVVCRHVVHSVPFADRVLAELVRVTRPGGWLHVLAEDYDMLHFEKGALDPREFWHEAPARFTDAGWGNLFIGRSSASMLQAFGLREVRLDYAIVDTLRVPRETFAHIIEAWRDGYVDVIAEKTRFSREETLALFEETIAGIRDPKRYAVWMVPIASGQVPAR